MRKLYYTIAGLCLVLALSHSSFAQQASPQGLVTQTATPNANYQVLCAAEPVVDVATPCVTPTPAANARVYVTSVCFDVATNGTGSAQTNVNYTLTGAAGFASATAITTYSIAASAELSQHWCQGNGGGVLYTSLAGTPITITPPTAVTNNSTGSTVFGYIAQ